MFPTTTAKTDVFWVLFVQLLHCRGYISDLFHPVDHIISIS